MFHNVKRLAFVAALVLTAACSDDASDGIGAMDDTLADAQPQDSGALVDDVQDEDDSAMNPVDADVTDADATEVSDADANIADTAVDAADTVATDTGVAADVIADVPDTDDVTPDVDPSPGCSNDADCTNLQRCLAGLCRDYCLAEWCGLASSGDVCHDDLCVECTADNDCAGRTRICDQASFTCAEGVVDPQHTKIGIFYFLWHCPASQRVLDLSDLSPSQWGNVGEFHYWDQPAAGYYCLSDNDALLRQHAVQLRDAGFDFVFLDVTNHGYTSGRSDRTAEMILNPLDRMLAVWSQVDGAPQIVPWVPVPEAATNPNLYTVDAILTRLGAYPGMHFNYRGKGLLLVTENSVHVPNEARLAELAQDYTVRRMWGLIGDPGSKWSFLQQCEQSPLDAAPCRQRVAVADGRIEQVSITVAYQASYMSVTSTATPKHGGDTFRKQFQTLFDNPQADIATITGWNEWVAQRQPCGQTPACNCATYPHGCFVDAWDSEYNRDIEPANNALGDLYYRLTHSCISVFRRGETCEDAQNADELCCQ